MQSNVLQTYFENIQITLIKNNNNNNILKHKNLKKEGTVIFDSEISQNKS